MPDKLIPGKKKTPVYYAVSSKKSPLAFNMKGFSYPGKAPKKRAPTKFVEVALGALGRGGRGRGMLGMGMLGGLWGMGGRGRGRGWRGYQQNKPYNRGWWTGGGEGARGRNRAQWGGQNYSSAGYKDQPYELATQSG